MEELTQYVRNRPEKLPWSRMAFCGSCLRGSVYVLVAVVAVLAYFHRECATEKEERERNKPRNEVFNPDVTDVNDCVLKFVPNNNKDQTVHGDLFMTLMPCPVQKLLLLVKGGNTDDTKQDGYKGFSITGKNGEKFDKNGDSLKKTVTIHDARKHSFGDFHDSGFTLIKLEEEPGTTDWRTPAMSSDDADIKKFHKLMEPHIRALYPGVKRLQWTYNVVRGGEGMMDQPRAVDQVHIDYHQNYTERVSFHKVFPTRPCADPCDPEILMGENDDEDGEFKVLLGIWKPIFPEEVCDYPLALMDGRTFKPEDQGLNKVHLSFGPLATISILGGSISHSDDQQWAYYPFQSTKEVLVFHQYSKERFFANPHTSFTNMNCPKDHGARVSVEMRLALYF